MAIGMVFFWLVIVVGIVALIQFSSRQSRMRAVPRMACAIATSW
jgi:hypothetical protein